MPILTCPECGNQLRTSASLTSGKRLVCPQCSNVIQVSDALVQASAATAAPPSRSWLEVAPPRTASPRPQRRPVRLISALAAAALLAGAVVLFVGFVFPGVFRNRSSSGDPDVERLLVFAPSGTDAVLGFDLQAPRSDEIQRGLVRSIQKKLDAGDFLPNLFGPAFADVTKGLLFARSPSQSGVLALSFRIPFQRTRLVEAFGAGPEAEVEGVRLHRIERPLRQPWFLAFPDHHTVLVGLLEEQAFVEAVGAPSLRRIAADLAAEARLASPAIGWGVARLDDAKRRSFGAAPFVGEMIADKLKNARIASFRLDAAENGKLRWSASTVLASEGDAERFETGVRDSWDRQGKALLLLGALSVRNIANLDLAAAEAGETFELQREGIRVTASAVLSRAALKSVSEIGNQPRLIPAPGLGDALDFIKRLKLPDFAQPKKKD